MKSWKTKKLSEVCAKITDGTHQTPKYFNEGVIFLSSKNVTSGKIDWVNIKYIDEKQHLEMHKRVAPKVGDILLAKNGTTGVAAMVDRDLVFDIYVSLALLRPLEGLLPDYLLHFINSPLAKNQFNKRLKGIGVPNLHLEEIREVEIPLPPLPEQQRIVAILDEAFAAIAKAKTNAEQNLKNAKELFESYLQGVFENGNWEEKKLEEICILISKGSSPKWQGIKYVDEPGVLFVTSENVGENTLLLEKRKYVEGKFNISDKKSILINGDVLTNIVGASIGRTAIFDLDDVANINQAVCLIRCNQEFLFNEYLMYLLNSPFTKQHLHDNEVNNARANLSLGFFRSLSIPLPELSDQKNVVDKIKSFHMETQRLESIYQQKINDLEELKKSVLQKAFSGELRSPEGAESDSEAETPLANKKTITSPERA
jgi:type I restriction enzyme S subunit